MRRVLLLSLVVSPLAGVQLSPAEEPRTPPDIVANRRAGARRSASTSAPAASWPGDDAGGEAGITPREIPAEAGVWAWGQIVPSQL